MISMGDEGVTPAPAGQPARRRARACSAGVVIDQHFDQRARYGRLLSIVAESPHLLGIGIDEDTAIVVTDRPRVHRARRAGRCSSRLPHRASPTPRRPARGAPLLVSGAVVHTLPAGATFDLRPGAAAPTSSSSTRTLLVDAGRGQGLSRDRRPTTCAHRAAATRGEAPMDRPRPRPAPPPPTCASSRPGSTAAATSGPTTRRSTSSSTSASLEELPHRHPARASPTASLELLPGPARAHLLRGRRGGFVERLRRGHLARPRRRARRAAAAAGGRPRHAPRQDPRRSRASRASTTSSTATSTSRSAWPPAGSPCAWSTTSSQADAGLRLRRGARALPPPRRAHGVRPVDRRRSSRRRSAATSRGSGSTSTPWCSSARASTQQRIRATMTSKTGALAVDIACDKDLTTRLLGVGRAAGAQAGVGAHGRGQAVAAARADRLPRRRQAARRQPRPRRVPRPAGRRRRARGLRRSPRTQSRRGYGHRRVVRHRPRLPLPDHRRPDAGHRRAGAGPRHRRRHAHRRASSSSSPTPTPAAASGHEKVLTRIKVDAAAVELRRASRASRSTTCRPTGEMVKLALTGNMSTGGISIDRTFEAHPDNVEIAEEAARMIGLDVAGIDFICPDIAQPVRETGGAICEVNAAPGFRMHTHPTIGEPQFIAKPVVDLLFPPGRAVAGADRRRHRHQRQDHDLADDRPHLQGHGPQGRHDLDRRRRHRRAARHQVPTPPGPRSARMVLQNPRVDFAVMEVARGGILREGLGYDRNDVAVVTNVAARPPRHARHRHPRAARRRQGRRRRGGAPRRVRRAQRRRPAGARDAAPLLRAGRVVLAWSEPGSRGARVHRRRTAAAAAGRRARAAPTAAT